MADVVDDFDQARDEGHAADEPPARVTEPTQQHPASEPGVYEFDPAPADEPGVASEADSLTGEIAFLAPATPIEPVPDVAAEPAAAPEPAPEPEPAAAEPAPAPGPAAEPEPAPEPSPEPAESDGETAAAELPEDLLAVSQGLDEPEATEVGEGGAAAGVATETTEGEPEGADASADEAEGSTEHAEQASDAASLDEIEPHTLHENETEAEDAAESEAESAALEVLSGAVPNWPFVLYVVVWLAAAAYGVWRFLQVPVGQAIFDNSLYVTSIMAGIGLLALGPVVLLVVWLVTFIKRGGRGWSLFVSALVKGAFVTLLGALIWMGALMLIDFLRVGRLL